MAAETAFIVWDLVRTARSVERRLLAVFDDLDLSPTQFGVLWALEHGQGATQAELAREVLVRPQSMTTLITSLIERAFITRDGPAGKGHRTRILITDGGRAAITRALPAVREGNRAHTLGLDDVDGDTLVRILADIRAGLEARAACSPEPWHGRGPTGG